MTTTLDRPKPTTLVRFDAAALEQIEQVVEDCQLAQNVAGKFAKAFAVAAGIRELRQRITPEMMQDIVQLQDTALGFRTDSDPKVAKWNSETRRKEYPEAYSVAVVKECLIEAVLRGARPVGNEFNIIAERTYMTREFYHRALGELPGVSAVKVSPAVPRLVGENGAVVRVSVTWRKDGAADGIVDEKGAPGREFAIRVNKSMGLDAIIGKATRKAMKAAYEQITGSSTPDGEVGDDAGTVPGTIVEGQPPASSAASELNQHLNKKSVAPVAQSANVHHDDQPADSGPSGDDAGDVGSSAAPPAPGNGVDLIEEALSGDWDQTRAVLIEQAEKGGTPNRLSARAIDGWAKMFAKGGDPKNLTDQQKRDAFDAIAEKRFEWSTMRIVASGK